ncbi:EAL domain-containing protein (putative c-di-GMP-specific phosphodiesterase class I)/GAF domain-containing protein [Pseudomonas sp. BIGb0408]|uniref:EAL domain-containing protein (Putative c-di-GMP-specific phosphodiesterase class I)/GAF domain-containing protein n=1 Tax=Phytopseudomonas flavescens TaxID=29435 RepID=A0A7Z0BPN6_9GAMM|nr:MULTISPECIES: sensor domain-containing phosphodiesterase [Pseudomonas]MCW2292359.1 EAL domain-containing protein (putative c-di-GMP-specific phosphodiesterase class I)/GAF domain-containing protein [Pseudomonas sp. BIGb0408]NYH73069.1 EAL domain-containing protein (putative c-di-GMP-specific phosphodiesterase class I)/GAF domain-containing protein [Pseudomonas flavescens]
MTSCNILTPQEERARLAEVDRLTSELEIGSDSVLNSVVAMISAYFGVPTALVSIIERDYQVFKARVGMEPERTLREMSFCAHNLDEGAVLEVCDPLSDPRFSSNPLVNGDPFIRYYAGAPLVIQPGLSLGRLCIIDRETHRPMDEQGQALLRDAAKVVVARLESIHLQHFYDLTTGLPNRQRFEADLLTESARDGRVAILVEPLSASGMDRLVKALGMEFFVNFMLAVKEVLLAVLPEGARLYRSGTLGFVTLFAPSQGLSMQSLLSGIVDALARPLYSADVPVFPDVGISVLQLDREAAAPMDILRLMASITDAARASERRWLDYDPAIDSSLRRSTELLNAIESALISADQFRLVYQPRVDLASNRCVAVEALLRWTHPTLGEISPTEFIPLAETTASIRHITRWVVRRVCEQLAQWASEGLEMTTSLNVSALDLTDGLLFDELVQALRDFDVAPQYIELEFTESVLVTDFPAVQAQLQRFRDLGVAIGIDDFGSGYSNWAYLRQIPATSVKLDRSLLADLQPGNSDWHIIRGLISLVKDLRLTVVAEGIETELHYHLLRGWGCQQGQGYYFAKPLSPAELVAWLNGHKSPAGLI